jgi:hypothetical protein
MEERYEFDGSAVIELLEESNAASERVMTEAQRYLAAGVDLAADMPVGDLDLDEEATGAPPGLWLLNDRGVYLRSNAAGGGTRVVHAEGHGAGNGAGLETIQEFIDGETLASLRPGDRLVVRLTGEKIRLSVVRDA